VGERGEGSGVEYTLSAPCWGMPEVEEGSLSGESMGKGMGSSRKDTEGPFLYGS
jgi:hypothetical protein